MVCRVSEHIHLRNDLNPHNYVVLLLIFYQISAMFAPRDDVKATAGRLLHDIETTSRRQSAGFFMTSRRHQGDSRQASWWHQDDIKATGILMTAKRHQGDSPQASRWKHTAPRSCQWSNNWGSILCWLSTALKSSVIESAAALRPPRITVVQVLAFRSTDLGDPPWLSVRHNTLLSAWHGPGPPLSSSAMRELRSPGDSAQPTW